MEIKMTEKQIEDKTRCTQFLLLMIAKYGSVVLEETKISKD